MAQPNPRPLLGIWGSGRIPDRRAFRTRGGVVPSHPLCLFRWFLPLSPSFCCDAARHGDGHHQRRLCGSRALTIKPPTRARHRIGSFSRAPGGYRTQEFSLYTLRLNSLFSLILATIFLNFRHPRSAPARAGPSLHPHPLSSAPTPLCSAPTRNSPFSGSAAPSSPPAPSNPQPHTLPHHDAALDASHPAR